MVICTTRKVLTTHVTDKKNAHVAIAFEKDIIYQ